MARQGAGGRLYRENNSRHSQPGAQWGARGSRGAVGRAGRSERAAGVRDTARTRRGARGTAGARSTTRGAQPWARPGRACVQAGRAG